MTSDGRWLAWQREHLDALRALQDAQRLYHRALSGHAFAAEGVAADAARGALLVMDEARIRLDEVRARQPY